MSTFLHFKVRPLAGSFFGLLVAGASWLPAQSQQVKQGTSPLLLADQYFAAGEYYTAAYLYEQYLKVPVGNKNAPAFTVYAKRGKTAEGTQNTSRSGILY